MPSQCDRRLSDCGNAALLHIGLVITGRVRAATHERLSRAAPSDRFRAHSHPISRRQIPHDRPPQIRSRFRFAAPAGPAQPGRHRARCAAAGRYRRDPEAGRAAARLRQPAGARQGGGRARNRCSSTTNCAAPSSSPPIPWSRSAAASCPRPNLLDEAAQCLRLLSGRNHRVYTAICLVTPKEAFRQRLVETRVRFKRLSARTISRPISAPANGAARPAATRCRASPDRFVVKMVGSYTNVVGLPLYEIDRAARRRRLPDPLRLAECQLSRQSAGPPAAGARKSRARSAASRPPRPRARSVPSAAGMSI